LGHAQAKGQGRRGARLECHAGPTLGPMPTARYTHVHLRVQQRRRCERIIDVNNEAFLLLLACLALTACESKQQPSGPDECTDVDSIFESEGCLEALMLECRALTDESECWAAATMEVEQGSVKCRWTEVVVVEDSETCEFGPAFGRCEAWMELGFMPVFDPCVDGLFTGNGHTVFPAEQELVDLAPVPEGVGSRGNLIGPWSAVEAAPGEVDSCDEGSDSALCACGPAACGL